MDGKNVDRLKLEGAYSSYISSVRERGGKSLFVVSENDGEAVLEGILSLFENPAEELEGTILEMNKMSVRTVLMLTEEERDRMISLVRGISKLTQSNSMGKENQANSLGKPSQFS